MASARQYREYADECVAWAKEAKSDQDRETFLKMAQDWLHAATLLEMPQSGPPLQPKP